MHRLILVFLLAVTASAAEPTFTAEEGGLKLEVSYEIVEQVPPPTLEKKDQKAESFFQVELTSVIKNVSDHEITLPTNTYEGGPTCFGGNPEAILYACYAVGLRQIQGQLIQSSPYRYFPVTLKPGERVELPPYHVRAEEKKRPVISWVRVEYSVEHEYAARYGWWSGTLRYEVIDKERRPIKTTTDNRRGVAPAVSEP